MKHIIFKGKRNTGKSLFADLIFRKKKSLFIDGRTIFQSGFPFEAGKDKWNFKNIIIDSFKKDFKIESIYKFITGDYLLINQQNRKSQEVEMPRFIILINSEFIELPETSSFKRRFHVIDFDTNSIADLMKVINEENIEIKINR